MRERDSREEDKEEGRGLGEGYFVFFFWRRNWGKKEEEEILKEEEIGEHIGFGNSHRDTVVAGKFGLRGQETARIPGARESERLFLVGWEVNIQFGAVWARVRKIRKGAKSTNLQVEVRILCILLVDLLLLCYYLLLIIMLLLLYFLV
jgi:hypothetical protein